MITPEQHAEIRRLYYGEHWKVGTIAAALGLHHETVQAAIAHDTGTVRRGTWSSSSLMRMIGSCLGLARSDARCQTLIESGGSRF